MEAYIDVKASTISMIACGTRLLTHHIQFITGTLTNVPREIVIYVRDMPDDELDKLEDLSESVILKRWNKDGTRLERDLQCRQYEGVLYATGRAMQAIDIKEMKIEPGLGFDVHWSKNMIEGVQRECLIMTNISETLGSLCNQTEKEISMRIHLGGLKVEAVADF